MFKRFHKIYLPHPALKEFVNNIMIQSVALDPSEPKLVLPMPPIQEQGIFFFLTTPFFKVNWNPVIN